MKKILPLVFALITFASCQSRDGDFTIFSPEEDLTLGKQMAAAIDADPENYPILEPAKHPELYKHLEGIRDKILASDDLFHRDDFSWQLRVIDNDTIYNAFCTPGGYIYVYTGLIRYVESEDELAGILGHEIAHGDLRHGTDQMTKTYGLKVVMGLLTGTDGELLTTLGINLLGLKFSRSDEEEADEYAVKYLSDTDYNPKAFAGFFERMEKEGGSMGPLQFLSTHPNPENRVKKINDFWVLEGSKEGADHQKSFKQLVSLLPDNTTF
jgi:predicted Zn-dependent protease